MIWSTKKQLPWTLFCGVWLISLTIVFVIWMEPAPRVGDGSEYYMMTMAWAEKLQPYADHETDRIYDEYRKKRDASFVSSAELQFYSQKLETDGQRDFPHFWFYSLLAAPFYLFLQCLGGDIGYAFTLLHLLMLGLLMVIAGNELGRRGIVLVILICFASPVLWFFDKAHTEFYTITTALVGVIYFLNSKFIPSSLAFSLAATQNPPFGIVALLVVAFGYLQDKKLLPRPFWMFGLALLILSLHPCYYLLRYGSPTPQWITGAASSSSKGWRELTCFVVDPDVGLISNWPWLVVPAIGVFAFAVLKKHQVKWTTVCFCTVSILILAWSQTKTNNFNHGGTVKISRYALWYIPFLLPMLLQFAHNYRLVPIWQRVAVFGFLVVAIGINSSKFHPTRMESYLYQTTIAENFYDQFPDWYDPVPEIFLERCLRAELPTDAWAISNRSGTKIIVHRGRLIKQQNRFRRGRMLDPVTGSENPIDPGKLVQHINEHVPLPEDPVWIYVNAPGDIFLKHEDLSLRQATGSRILR